MDAIWRDLKLAARTLSRSRGFTAIAALTLALGIGANTAIFTLIHAVMLRPLPVVNPSELYRLGDTNNCCVNGGLQNSYSLFPYPLYQTLHDRTPEFVELAAFQPSLTPLSIRRAGVSQVAEPFRGEFVSGNYFTMFGVRAFAGRVLSASDDNRAAPTPAVVMNYRTWHDRYGMDPTLIGAAITLNSVAATIVGIAAQDFFGDTLQSDPPDFWIPLGAEPVIRGATSLLSSNGQAWLYSIGRLRPTTNPLQVQARITAVLQQWLTAVPNLDTQERARVSKQHITLTSGASGVTTMTIRYGAGLRILAVVSGLVLLIACANIANLLLSRANQFQLAVRAALGATQSRIIRQTMTEGVLLALFGGAAGIAVAYAGTRAIVLLAFRGAKYVPIDARPSPPVLAFALLLSLLTGVIFSVVPAWILSKANPIDSLRRGSRFTADRSSIPRNSLVILQVALSLVLLVGAGLLTESLWRLEHQPFGFETEGRMTVPVFPALAGYMCGRKSRPGRRFFCRFCRLSRTTMRVRCLLRRDQIISTTSCCASRGGRKTSKA